MWFAIDFKKDYKVNSLVLDPEAALQAANDQIGQLAA